MATYYNHCQVGIVDASGNVNVIYPQTYASDVKVGTANSSIGITTSSTVQSLISALGSAATKNVGDLVTNSSSSSSTSQAYSCNQINSKLNELNSKIIFSFETITLVGGNWGGIAKPGYDLLSASTNRSDTSYHVVGFSMNGSSWIIYFSDTNTGAQVSVICFWLKVS